MYVENYVNRFESIPTLKTDHSPFGDTIQIEEFTSIVFNEYCNYKELLNQTMENKDILQETVQILQEISFKDIWDKIKKWFKKLGDIFASFRKKIANFLSKRKTDQVNKDLKEAEEEVKRSTEEVVTPDNRDEQKEGSKEDVIQVLDGSIKGRLDQIMIECMHNSENPYKKISNALRHDYPQIKGKLRRILLTYYDLRIYFTVSANNKWNSWLVGSKNVKNMADNLIEDINEKFDNFKEYAEQMNRENEERRQELEKRAKRNGRKTLASAFDDTMDKFHNDRQKYTKDLKYTSMGVRHSDLLLMSSYLFAVDEISRKFIVTDRSVDNPNMLIKSVDTDFINKEFIIPAELRSIDPKLNFGSKQSIIEFYRFCKNALDKTKDEIDNAQQCLSISENQKKVFESCIDKWMSDPVIQAEPEEFMKLINGTVAIYRTVCNWNFNYVNFVLSNDHKCLKVLERMTRNKIEG